MYGEMKEKDLFVWDMYAIAANESMPCLIRVNGGQPFAKYSNHWTLLLDANWCELLCLNANIKRGAAGCRCTFAKSCKA